MNPNLIMTIILPILSSCTTPPPSEQPIDQNINTVGDIKLPLGFTRLQAEEGSFASWLRNLAIRGDNTVYLFNGNKKQNQQAQYAVLDVSVGKKDLQQCADAIMRLRADYLLSEGRASEISFRDNNGKQYKAPLNGNRQDFDRYLEQVYAYCGTLSLEKQLRPKQAFNSISPGDVLIKGGSPGHAAIVLDVAVNREGHRIFLLANSYMPAQDIHIVNNPTAPSLSPWYSAENRSLIELPEWRFTVNQLKSW